MNHDVFISYSSKNINAAKAACHVLEENGIRCWMAPRDIPAGGDFGDIIDQAIEYCKAFVIIYSQESSLSQWVKGELNLAFSEEKYIIPYRIDNTPLKGAMRLILNQMHWIEAYPDANSKFGELAETIKRLIGKPASAPTREAKTATPAAPATSTTPSEPTQKPPRVSLGGRLGSSLKPKATTATTEGTATPAATAETPAETPAQKPPRVSLGGRLGSSLKPKAAAATEGAATTETPATHTATTETPATPAETPAQKPARVSLGGRLGSSLKPKTKPATEETAPATPEQVETPAETPAQKPARVSLGGRLGSSLKPKTEPASENTTPARKAEPATENADTLYSVILKDAGAVKLQVMKLIKDALGLSLLDAKNMVDRTPSELGNKFTKAEAEQIVAMLGEAGATAEIKAN